MYPHAEFFEELQAEIDRLRQGREGSGTIEWRGEVISVQRTGTSMADGGKRAPYFPYVITWRGLRLSFQPFPDATKNTPNVLLYVSSSPLIAKSGDLWPVWDEARYFLETLLLGRISRTAVSRLDIFVDLVDRTPGDFWESFQCGRFIRRSRRWEIYTDSAAVNAELVQGIVEAARDELAVQVYASGQRVTTLQLGSGSAIRCRIYDKLLEMDSKEDVVKFEAMRAAYWGGEVPADLCRIEWQMRGRQLKEAGVTDVESLRSELGNIAGWLCQSWVTVREDGVDRNHAKRSGYHPDWQRVVDTVSARFGGNWNADSRLVPALVERSGLLAQAVGCISSALAEGDFPGSEEELIEKMVDSILEGLNRCGVSTAFDRLKKKVMEHYARVRSCWNDLSRRMPDDPVRVLPGVGAVRFADYAGAPGGVYGIGDNARNIPDIALALDAEGAEPLEYSPEQWEYWRKTWRPPAAAGDQATGGPAVAGQGGTGLGDQSAGVGHWECN